MGSYSVLYTGSGLRQEEYISRWYIYGRFQYRQQYVSCEEAYDGKGILTVENGQMTIHVSMPSKNIVNLYLGSAEDAQKDGAELIQPVTDTVTYSDGTTEEVNGFDVPVPVIDEEFDLALIGKKGVWYDHKVSVSNPVAVEETESK